MNNANFSFEEETYAGTSQARNTTKSSFAQMIIQSSGGIIKTETQANVLMILISIILLLVSLVYFRNSTPPLAPEHMRGVSNDELEAYRSVQPF